MKFKPEDGEPGCAFIIVAPFCEIETIRDYGIQRAKKYGPVTLDVGSAFNSMYEFIETIAPDNGAREASFIHLKATYDSVIQAMKEGSSGDGAE